VFILCGNTAKIQNNSFKQSLFIVTGTFLNFRGVFTNNEHSLFAPPNLYPSWKKRFEFLAPFAIRKEPNNEKLRPFARANSQTMGKAVAIVAGGRLLLDRVRRVRLLLLRTLSSFSFAAK
jgi:hypothetical protein